MRNLILLGLVGLFAQLVDGSLGMAYGVTSSTLLLATGIAPAAASAAVHLAEIGTTLVSGVSHYKLGQRRLAHRRHHRGARRHRRVRWARRRCRTSTARPAAPYVGALLLSLGVYVLYRFLALGGRSGPTFKGTLSKRFLAPLGLVAGAVDAIGGGGWGPVGTTSLLSSGRLEPRKVDRLDRHLGVRRRHRRLARLPARAGQPGHPVRRRGRAAGRRRRRGADRRVAGQAPRRPRARRRRRRSHRRHQRGHDPRGRRPLRHRRWYVVVAACSPLPGWRSSSGPCGRSAARSPRSRRTPTTPSPPERALVARERPVLRSDPSF